MTGRMKALLLLGGALTIAVGLDRLRRDPMPEVAIPVQPAFETDTGLMSQGALNPVAGLTPDILAPILDRPLFRPSRSPALPESDDSAVPSPVSAPVAVVPARVPTLLGTVNLPKPGGAFLADGGSGEAAFVVVGQSFGPWQLISVGDGWAELDGSEGPLRLAFPQPQHLGQQAVAP